MRWERRRYLASLVLAVGCGRREGDPRPPAVSPPSPITAPESDNAPLQESAKPLVDLSQAGKITGRVTFQGIPPKPRVLRTEADLFCSAIHKHDPLFSEEVVVGVCQGSCRLFGSHEVGISSRRALLEPVGSSGFWGLRYTSSIGVQFLVEPVQRSGWRCLVLW